jgi:hypothetical protein
MPVGSIPAAAAGAAETVAAIVASTLPALLLLMTDLGGDADRVPSLVKKADSIPTSLHMKWMNSRMKGAREMRYTCVRG